MSGRRAAYLRRAGASHCRLEADKQSSPPHSSAEPPSAAAGAQSVGRGPGHREPERERERERGRDRASAPLTGEFEEVK